MMIGDLGIDWFCLLAAEAPPAVATAKAMRIGGSQWQFNTGERRGPRLSSLVRSLDRRRRLEPDERRAYSSSRRLCRWRRRLAVASRRRSRVANRELRAADCAEASAKIHALVSGAGVAQPARLCGLHGPDRHWPCTGRSSFERALVFNCAQRTFSLVAVFGQWSLSVRRRRERTFCYASWAAENFCATREARANFSVLAHIWCRFDAIIQFLPA